MAKVKTVRPAMSEERIQAASALVEAGKVSEDFAGLSDEQALDVIMLAGIDEQEARMILAMARGESTGDVVAVRADEQL